MPIANVELTNTFDEWRVRTNQVIVQGEQLLVNVTSQSAHISFLYASANASSNVANVALANSATANARAVAAFTTANTANAGYVVAFAAANTASDRAVSAFGFANTVNVRAVSAFTAANTANDRAVSAFAVANIANSGYVVAFTAANTASDRAVSAFGAANTANDRAVAAFTAANTKLTNTTTTLAGSLTLTGNLTLQRVWSANGAVDQISHSFLYFPYMGMYAISANTLGFATANTLRMSIDSAGRITGGGTAGSNGFNGFGDRFISTAAPSGGSDGDIWYKVE